MLSDQDTVGQFFFFYFFFLFFCGGGGGGGGMLRDCASMLGIRVVYKGSHLRGI